VEYTRSIDFSSGRRYRNRRVLALRGRGEVLVLLLLSLQKRSGIAVYLILVVAVRCIVGDDFDTGERITLCFFGVRLFLHRCLFTVMMY
jgi:hypothetical protein